ncbi:MAG: folate-binding protein [Planctomycetota bacterium]|nr:MAG: folate-binding protein [Planctomycetota bacterium]
MNDADRSAMLTDYDALTRGVGFALLDGRTQIEVRGADRASFLHGMCTNDVKNLTPGRGREAFFTNVQGKTIGHAYLFAAADAICIDTTPGQAAALVPALDRYIIREKIELYDRTTERGELLIAGPSAAALLEQVSGQKPPSERLDHTAIALGGKSASLRRVDFVAGGCFFVACAAADLDAVVELLESAGAKRIADATLDAARIEQGTPLFGRDISPDNLPQELARDALAISFTKGCYLGQETVARIDALGHVNRYLAGVRFEGDRVPPPGTPLFAADKQVGEITSAAFSPRLKAPLALAFVRRGHHQQGTRLQSTIAVAETVALPLTTA